MIPAVVTDPASGQPVVVASLERQRVALEKEIKDACNEFLNEPDWNKNMSIVDQLNRSPYLCPFAIKEIRLQLKTKNPEVEILALQLAETIIKNCPSSHAAVAQEDFMRYLVKVGTDQRQGGKWTQLKTKMKSKRKIPVNSKHLRSQCIEKALLILKMLAIAYSDSNLYPVFRATVRQLESQKVRFPETNKDESLNIFSPIHSSNASAPTAMGSVQNVNLPMIRPVILLENISNSELIQAQEQAQLLFSMINAPVLSYDLIPDLTSMLNGSQQQIVIMISEGNADELILTQALQVNDIVNQVLEDAQAIMNGTKRRYQEEIDVQKLVLQKSDSERKEDDDDVSLEHSISIGDNDNDLIKLSAPQKDKLNKKRLSKKGKRQSMDLLGITDEKNGNDLMSAINDNKVKKKEESEENILDFLGVKNEPQKVKVNSNVPTVFDPLDDLASGGQEQAPPMAFTGANYGNYNNGNSNNNNGNVFRNNNNNNNNKLTAVDKGNASVLNVLTGEPSPSQSYNTSNASSNNGSNKNTPMKVQQPPQQQPKQQYNINNNNNNNIKKENKPKDEFDTGNDPFADFGSGNKLFDDNNNNNNNKIIEPIEKKEDPFSGMGGNAFDDPNMNKPKQQQSNIFAPQNNTYKTANNNIKPAPPKKQDSDAIILDMFSAGASPDPNTSAPKPKPESNLKPKGDDNPFDSLANPFGSNNQLQNVNNNNNNNANAKGGDDNPFDALDNPFGVSGDDVGSGGGGDSDNPFLSNNNNKKGDDFMGDRDPFADM